MDARRCHTSRKQVQWWGKKCGRIRTSLSNNLIRSHLKLHRNICLKLFSKSVSQTIDHFGLYCWKIKVQIVFTLK